MTGSCSKYWSASQQKWQPLINCPAGGRCPDPPNQGLFDGEIVMQMCE